MRNNKLKYFAVILLLLVFSVSFGQNKNTKKPAENKKPQSGKQSSTDKNKEKESTRSTAVINFTPEQIETFKQQSAQIVKFFEGTLNFLIDKRNPVKEKQTIINSSYLKSFWDEKVQVEDDLDEKRLVPLYKDIPAYLTDVDFFFKRGKFTYTVQDVNVLTNELGQTYFKVTANRQLNGITVTGDSVNSNKVRYIEINYDDTKQELKIVSIYTTKLNEQDDMRNWWNGLPQAWRDILGKDIQISSTNNLNEVTFLSDSISTVAGSPVKLETQRIYPLLVKFITQGKISLAGNRDITDLEPISKMSNLKEVDLSGSAVTDLMPLRNLNDLQALDISNTKVESLEPLRYANHVQVLKMKGTMVPDLLVVGGFSELTTLDISSTPIVSLEPIKDLTMMKDLRFSETDIADLAPVSGMQELTVLYFNATKVKDVTPLQDLKNLQVVVFDNTEVSSIKAFNNMPSLIRLFCDNSNVSRQEAIEFMVKHPSILVIFATDELQKWWASMPEDWKRVFNTYRKIDPTPTTEQLHRLATIDSVSVNGRSSIQNLDPVAELSELKTLEFASTSVSDLGPLKGLKRLYLINGANSKVSDVAPLAGLDSLKVLSLNNTAVSDLTPLKDNKNLKLIYADNTSVTQKEANDFMDASKNCLVISQTYDNTNWWSGLSKAWKDNLLKQVNVKGEPDKIQLQQIAGLETLNVSGDINIIDLRPVQKMSRLADLDFSDTRVSDLTPLSGKGSLKVLKFSKTPVSDMTPIGNLTGLKELDFSNTQVEDLMALQNLTELETLKFSGTPVKNLKFIQNLRSLKNIEFYNTRVSNLDILEPMSGLQSLKIFNTKISEKKVEKFKMAHPSCEVIFY